MKGTSYVPRWLGFSWWWLSPVAAIFMGSVFSTGDHYRFYLIALLGVQIWGLVQGAWLKASQRESIAVYWLAGGFFLQLLRNILPVFSLFSSSFVLGEPGMLLQAACYIAGSCYFVHELQNYAEETQRKTLRISYLMATFCHVFYFQFKLHEVRQSAQAVAGLNA